MKKVKTETECKNGSQHSRCIPNAHLTFEYSLKAFFTQLLQLKVNTHTKKRNFQSFYIKPGMQCLRCVEREHRKPFLHFFLSFPTVLYCNCVKLKYAPCCVVSSLCPNDLICEKTTVPDAKSKRSVDLSLVRFSSEVCISVGSESHPGSCPLCPPPSWTAFVSVLRKQQQVVLVN